MAAGVAARTICAAPVATGCSIAFTRNNEPAGLIFRERRLLCVVAATVDLTFTSGGERDPTLRALACFGTEVLPRLREF